VAATIGYMTAQASRPGARVLAWSLAGFILLVLAGALVLLPFNVRVMSPTRIGAYVFAVVAVVVYAGIGGLIAARIPRNPIGWLLCLTGLALAVSLFLEQYGLRGLATAPGSLPAVRQITALGYGTQQLAITPLIVLVLLFPDGRLPSRRWRPVLWCAIAAVIGAGFAQLLQRGTTVTGSLTNALLAAHVAYPNPFGIFPRHGWYSSLIAVAGAITLATAVLAVISVFARRRGASAELRQQLAWLAYVGGLTAGFAVLMIVYVLATHGGNTWLGSILFVLVFGTPIFGIPLASAVAVLRYRLYDLDVVVKKTVVAAVVAAVFTAVYVLIVVAVGAVTGHPGGQPAHVRGGRAGRRAAAARPGPGRAVGGPPGLRQAGHPVRGAVGVLRANSRHLLDRGRAAQDGPDAGRGHRGEAGRGVAADGEQRAPGGGVAVR
jgi:hypothetical protein